MEIWKGEIYRGRAELVGTPFDLSDYYDLSMNKCALPFAVLHRG